MMKSKLKKRINFIPRDQQPKIEIPHELPALILVILSVVVVGVSFFRIHLQTGMTTRELAELNNQNSQLVEKIKNLTTDTQILEKKSETLTILNKVLGRKNYWSEIFKELSNVMPPGIWLTSFSNSEENTLVLRGESTSQNKVADFLKLLEGSEHFSGARMKFSERESGIHPTRYKFEFLIPVTSVSGGGT